jgi:hypothetical protein
MNFVLIGKGLWGNKLHNNLKKLGNVKKIITSKDDYKNINLKNIDWVVIATPNKFHYQHVKFFLEKKMNVFCEKPLTTNYNLTKKLIKISQNNKTNLYIDDIEIFKNKKIILKKENYIYRNKLSNYDFKQTLFALAYHDFYILSKFIYNDKTKIKIINTKNKLYHFKVENKKLIFDFKYDLKKKPQHKINNTNFESKKNYILKMFKNVFFLNVNFKENHDRALKASYLIDRIIKKNENTLCN